MFMIGVALLALTIVPVYVISIILFNSGTIWATIKRVFFTLLVSAIVILIIASIFLSSAVKSVFQYVGENPDPVSVETTKVETENAVQDKYCVLDKMGIKRCPSGHYEY